MEAFSDLLGFFAGIPAIVGLVLASAFIFLSSRWRLSLTALLFQYIFAAAILSRTIEVELVIVKVLTGVLATAMLYISAQYSDEPSDARRGPDDLQFLGWSVGWNAGPLGLPVRILVILAIGLTVFRFYGQLDSLISVFEGGASAITPDIVLVVFWLVALGLVGLVVSAMPLRAAPALLTILLGFDLVYAHLDSRLPVAGAFGALILLVTLAFSYLILGMSYRQTPSSSAGLGQDDVTAADQESSILGGATHE